MVRNKRLARPTCIREELAQIRHQRRRRPGAQRPPGAVIVLPGGTPYFHWAMSGEYVTQVTAFGPISLQYLNPDDDPRNA
jgi:hypothetical protein